MNRTRALSCRRLTHKAFSSTIFQWLRKMTLRIHITTFRPSSRMNRQSRLCEVNVSNSKICRSIIWSVANVKYSPLVSLGFFFSCFTRCSKFMVYTHRWIFTMLYCAYVHYLQLLNDARFRTCNKYQIIWTNSVKTTQNKS